MDSDESRYRPTLPNGWRLHDGISIERHLGRSRFIDVFSLSDATFLYVILDTLVAKKVREKYGNYEEIKGAEKPLIAVRFGSHSDAMVQKRLELITERRGLNAVAGMAHLKVAIRRDIVAPLQERDLHRKYGLGLPNGLLLYGPPGCGKTFIAKKIAEELSVPLIAINESDIGSSYVHGTTARIASVFGEANSKAPCVLFFDEISSFLPKRDSLISSQQYKESEVSEFLVHLESAGAKGVLVIGATNFPERLDSAIMRSGRMDKRFLIGPPDKEARMEIFKLQLEDRPHTVGANLEFMADLTEGFVSSDIKLAVDNAARIALAAKEAISTEHLLESVRNLSPSISEEELDRYISLGTLQRI